MKRCLLIVTIFIIANLGYSQKVEYNNSVQDFITKSTPQAYQFQKYGDLPVNANTGLVEIGIPMFSVGIKNVDWKIGLSYHAGGIKVNEIAGCAGLGWSLNAAGMISSRNYQRSDVFIENQGDETANKKTFNLTPTSGNSGEIHLCHYANPADCGFANNIIQMKQNGAAMNYIPDIFYLSAGNLNAKFFLKNHKGYCLPSKDILIEHFPGTTENTNPGYWIITDENGTKYTFEAGGGNASESMWDNDFPDGAGGPNPLAFDNFNPTFILKKIENVTGEKIWFYYTSETYRYRGNNTDVYHVNLPTQNTSGCQNPINGFLPLQHKAVYNYVMESRLDSIFTSNGESVVFTYSPRTDMLGLTKLNKVTKYFRTVSTYQVIKAFDLANSYFGTGTDSRELRLKLENVTEKSKDNVSGMQYSFQYNATQLPNRISTAQDVYGYYNGQLNNQNLIPVYGGDRTISFQNTKASVLERITYPTGGYTNLEYELKQYGGLRTKKKTDYSGGQGYNYKEYEYGSIYSGSGTASAPVFSKDINFYYLHCPSSSAIPPIQINCPATQTYSEPVKSLYETYYGIDNTERYSSVTEYYGLNGINGKTVFTYTDPTLNFEAGRLGAEDLLLSKAVYKKNGTIYEPVSSETNFYSVLNETSSGFFSLPVNLREVRTWGLDFDQEKEEQIGNCPGGEGGTSYAMCFPSQLFQYSIRLVSSPILLSKQESILYSGGLTPVLTKKEFEYDGNKNLLPNNISTYDSRLEKIIEKIKYPTDYAGIISVDPVSAGINNLNDKHIISDAIEKSTYRQNINGSNTRLISSVFTTYKPTLSLPDKIYSVEINKGITNFVPSSVQSGLVIKDAGYKEKISYNFYNSYGDPVELQKKDDVKTCYVWGEILTDLLNNKYRTPIASVTNASQTDIAYTSFEADGMGNWIFTGTSVLDVAPPTGKMSYVLNGTASTNITKLVLNTATTYVLSYWTKNAGAFIIPGTIVNYPIRGRSINGWTYYEHKIAGQSAVTISGSGSIDELRLYPEKALMTSYTYAPLIGMTTQCDANNRISYYQYDGFNRLILIRDQDNNILKKICYNYAGQPQTCSCLNTNADWQNTATAIRCKTVGGINTGEREREQKDMSNCSLTYNQLRWVVIDQNCAVCPKLAVWQASGNYRCVKDGSNNNTGYQEKEERDTEACSSTYNQLRWVSNGYNPTACPVTVLCTYSNCMFQGEGYACINGQCELGVRVNTASNYNSSTGQYECIYHYEYSDGSWSVNYSSFDFNPCAL
jgi:hypothetical protein